MSLANVQARALRLHAQGRREFLFRYFDDEGIVKKGKKMTYKELAAELAATGNDPNTDV